jgi:hypothetical protein
MAGPFDNLPPEVALEQQRLTRQQHLANALLQNNQQPQGQMVSGRFVAPSIFQNLQPVANMLTGAYLSNKADEKSLALAQQLRNRNQADIQNFMGAMTPTTTTTEMAGPYGVSGSGQNIPMPTATQTQGPDFAKAFRIAYGSYDPALKAQALDMLKTQKLGEGETLNRMDFSTGKLVPIAEGGEKVAPEVRSAAQALGIRGNPSTWTPQQTEAVRNQMSSFKRDSSSKFDFSNLLGKSATSEVGPMLVASKTAAGSAVQQADAANRILAAVNTDKIFAGAGANQKLQLAQIGQMVGATGNTADEKIANTRSAIQGLAQLTLQGRQQMKGQGAVTESEGALAQRAVSGDVSLTAGELRQLAEAAKRTAKFQYDQHQSMVQALAKDQPNAVPYYQLEVNPSIFDPYGTKSSVRSQADAIVGGNK